MQSQIKMLAECPGLSSRLSLNELQTTFSTLSTLRDNAEMHTNDDQEAEKEVQRLKAVSKAKKQLRAAILPCSSLQVWPSGGAPEYGQTSPSKSDIPAATVLYQFKFAAEQLQRSKSLVRNALYSSAFVELRSSCFLRMAGSLLCLGFYLASLRTLFCPSGVPLRPPRPTALALSSHTCTGLPKHSTQAMRHRSFASLSATLRESRVLQLAPVASR